MDTILIHRLEELKEIAGDDMTMPEVRVLEENLVYFNLLTWVDRKSSRVGVLECDEDTFLQMVERTTDVFSAFVRATDRDSLVEVFLPDLDTEALEALLEDAMIHSDESLVEIIGLILDDRKEA